MSKISDLIEIKNGKIFPKEKGNIPIYGGNGIIGYTNKYNFENVVIIGRVGANCGSVHVEKGKCWVSDNALAGVPLNQNSIFNYYFLKSLGLNKKQIGSSQPLLTQGILNNLTITYPIIESVQQKIASVLSALDSKIELNNRINAELEAMAKTIYDYWFVQFDFPDKNGKPYKTSGGKMVWNEELKREIPEGWEVKELDSLLSVFTKGLTTSYLDKSNLINLNQKVNKGWNLDRQYFKFLDPEIEIPNEKYAHERDILINSLGQGTLGRIHYFCDNVENIVVDQHLFILRVDESKITSSYLFLILDSNPYKKQIDRQITGSTGMQMLNGSNLKSMQLLVPSIQILSQFENIIYPLFEKRVNSEKQNLKLAEIRDWLLPMLMNGQVKVN